jgi:type VI secretion system protein ImpJ
VTDFSKVVWTEGLFLRPQHFQQQDRHAAYLVRASTAGLQPLRWGVSRLTVDAALLESGKVALDGAAGVLPDGTPFDLPAAGELPPPLAPDAATRDRLVYLALPLQQPGVPEVDLDGAVNGAARYHVNEADLGDSTASGGERVSLALAAPAFQLKLAGDDLGGFQTLPIARISEVRSDRQVVLDPDYIPPLLDIRATPTIGGFLDWLAGILTQRTGRLAARASEAGRGSAELVDLLRLQAMNRVLPRVTHMAKLPDVHPLAAYDLLLEIAGELSTFTEQRQPPAFPAYDQDDLAATFQPVFAAIREIFTKEPEAAATEIPLSAINRYGICRGQVNDRALLANARFVLVVTADMPAERLRGTFPGQVVVGPVERISELVNRALPGIKLRPLPAAPRQLPFHAGATYFELDPGSPLWSELATSGAIAFQIGGTYPNMTMALWALRE